MKRIKTKRIVKSIKLINKQIRVLQRGVHQRNTTNTRIREQEHSRSSSEHIEAKNDEIIQRAIGGNVRVLMLASAAVRKRLLHVDQVTDSFLKIERGMKPSLRIKLARWPVKWKQPRIVRQKALRITEKVVLQQLTQRRPAGKKSLKYTTVNVKADRSRKERAYEPQQRVTTVVAPLASWKAKQKRGINPSKTRSMVLHTFKQMNKLSPKVSHAPRRDKHTEQQKQTLQAAIQTRNSIQLTRAVVQMNIRIMKMLVRATALLVKGMAALLGVSSSVIILLCIMMIIAALLSSPFAIFVADENNEPGTQKLSIIVGDIDNQFKARIVQERQTAGDIDRVELHYAGSADNSRIDNWPEVLAVFAVQTSMSSAGFDVATMDKSRIEMLQAVYWDMNQLTAHVETLEHTEVVIIEQEDGSREEQKVTEYERVLHLSVTARTAEQQAAFYQFNAEQTDLMNELLSAGFRPMMLSLLGKEDHVGLSVGELEAIQTSLPPGVLGSQAVELALTRLGDPYSQLKAGQGSYTDCSYLVQWVYKQLEVGLPRTAAEQARFIVDNGRALNADELKAGDLIFWSYEKNGRFMNITHVGIYAGNGKVVDASSSRLQVVYRNVFDADRQVLYGRPYLSGGDPAI